MSIIDKRVRFISDNSSIIRIKICGVTRKDDIRTCARLGVNAVGFLLQKKPDISCVTSDRVPLNIAKELADEACINKIASVILIKTTDLNEIDHIIETVNPTSIQLQEKSMNVELISSLREKHKELEIIRTFYISHDTSVEENLFEISEISEYVDSILLDSKKGGCGKTHDWSISKEIRDSIKGPNVILAGGLNPDNIEYAIRAVKPDAIDVMTGSTSEVKGVKDPKKIARLVNSCQPL